MKLEFEGLYHLGAQRKNWAIMKLFRYLPPTTSRIKAKSQCNWAYWETCKVLHKNFPPSAFLYVSNFNTSFKWVEILRCEILVRKTIVYVYNGTCTYEEGEVFPIYRYNTLKKNCVVWCGLQTKIFQELGSSLYGISFSLCSMEAKELWSNSRSTTKENLSELHRSGEVESSVLSLAVLY